MKSPAASHRTASQPQKHGRAEKEMPDTEQMPAAHTTAKESSWPGAYLIGGIAALLPLIGTLTDIAITMIPGWEASTTPDTIQARFTQLHSSPLLGLRTLDLLNVPISAIGIPMYLAL